MKFTLRQIAVFAAVARQESVSRAAESLSLSQSAVSMSLNELEKQFDAKVFLEVWVKVKSGWTDDERLLKSLGYE